MCGFDKKCDFPNYRRKKFRRDWPFVYSGLVPQRTHCVYSTSRLIWLRRYFKFQTSAGSARFVKLCQGDFAYSCTALVSNKWDSGPEDGLRFGKSFCSQFSSGTNRVPAVLAACSARLWQSRGDISKFFVRRIHYYLKVYGRSYLMAFLLSASLNL